MHNNKYTTFMKRAIFIIFITQIFLLYPKIYICFHMLNITLHTQIYGKRKLTSHHNKRKIIVIVPWQGLIRKIDSLWDCQFSNPNI